MDQVQRQFCDLNFQLAYATKKGEEFQAWFQTLAAHAYGPDFEAVRPYGQQGDHKCDGLRVSTKTIFQVYAPHQMVAARLEAKIRADFLGALEHWPDMKTWVLVTNAEAGLPPSTVKLLDALRHEHPSVEIATWAEVAIRRLTRGFSLQDWRDVFGDVPTESDWRQLEVADIKDVLDDLEHLEPEPGQEPLSPPSLEKLEHNALSSAAADFLKLGWQKEALVQRYLDRTPNPTLGERIAEAFRQRYARLRREGLSPDEIFGRLQAYAGATGGSPQRQVAGLAVLSYFFERCDIFEDAPEAT